jgi:hypothetical protein
MSEDSGRAINNKNGDYQRALRGVQQRRSMSIASLVIKMGAARKLYLAAMIKSLRAL